MSFVRQFAMERFLPEDIVDYAPGYKTALTGNARLYADDVLGAANPAHAYNAKRQLADMIDSQISSRMEDFLQITHQYAK